MNVFSVAYPIHFVLFAHFLH